MKPLLLTRRASLSVAFVALASCSRAKAARCAYCGMPIDPESPWNAELVKVDGTKGRFDSPRCALLAWRTGKVDAKEIRVEEYYDRTWKSGSDVVFVASSDVMGPMGADLVPVDPERAKEFAREHTGTRPLALEEVTLELLKELR
jgi:nitrous oxide reductase accessory protein NosL